MFGFPRRAVDRVEFQQAPADIVDRDLLEFTPSEVVALIDLYLTAQSELDAEDRNDGLIDALLAIRGLLSVPVGGVS